MNSIKLRVILKCMLKIISYHYISYIFFFLFSFLCLSDVFALCINVEKANLRSGPGKNYRVTWVVGKYMPFIEIGKKGPWTHIRDLEGKKHWVHESLLTSKLQCVVVKKRRALLRQKPSKKASFTPFRQVDKYTPFKRVQSKGRWYYLEDSFGQRSWVEKSKVWWPLRVTSVEF